VIRVVVDDLAFVAADALVRPATAHLEPTTPSLRRLEQVGGPTFWQQLKVQQELAVGSAVVTGAGELPAEFVVHAVIRSETEAVSGSSVRRALLSALQRAVDWQLSRLAVPPLGVGPGGLEPEDAARIVCEVVVQHVLGGAAHPSEVSIVVESEQDRAMFEGFLARAWT